MGYLNDGAIIEKYAGLDMNTGAIQANVGDDYIAAMRQLDITQNCNKYKWNGLPKHLSSWLIELMLYARGSLCGFIYGGELKILPFTSTGTLNEVGLFTKVQPMSYNGQLNGGDGKYNISEIDVYDGRGGSKNPACILFDNLPYINQSYKVMPRFVLNNKFVEWQADLLGRIKINIANSTKRILIKCPNEAQKRQLEKDLKAAYSTNNPFIIYTDGAPLETDGTFLDIKDDLHAQDLIETWQSLNNIRCMLSGIDNTGAFEKKERKITAEQTGNQEQTDIVNDSGLSLRKWFIDCLKDAYPDNEVVQGLSVELVSDNLYNIDIKAIGGKEDETNNK